MNVQELIKRLNSDIICQYRMMCQRVKWYTQRAGGMRWLGFETQNFKNR